MRKCVRATLTIGFLLILQSEHIQIFPITVASTFVTLSWNSSGALSTGRGYILQVSQRSSSSKVVPRTRQVRIEDICYVLIDTVHYT